MPQAAAVAAMVVVGAAQVVMQNKQISAAKKNARKQEERIAEQEEKAEAQAAAARSKQDRLNQQGFAGNNIELGRQDDTLGTSSAGGTASVATPAGATKKRTKTGINQGVGGSVGI